MTIQDLFIGTFPGCLCCCDKSRHENGDYKEIARISRAGKIKWIEPAATVPPEVREMIEFHAGLESVEFDRKIELELFYNPGRLYERILDSMPWPRFVEWTSRKRDPQKSLADLCKELLPEYKERI